MDKKFYNDILKDIESKKKTLAILIDPEKFQLELTEQFLTQIPTDTTHIFVGGSTVAQGDTDRVVQHIKQKTNLPVFLFPGDFSQLTPLADALLFLNLVSGRNPEYLIGQQVKAIPMLKKTNLEIIPTAYLLIDGGNHSSVARVTNTTPLSQTKVDEIVNTALAGQYMGAQMVYLEAGSGAQFPVRPEIIRAVKKALDIPLIVGGGIRDEAQKQTAYQNGADMVVMGTVFEKQLLAQTK